VFGAVVAGARRSTHRTNATHNAAAVATVEKARKKKKKKRKRQDGQPFIFHYTPPSPLSLKDPYRPKQTQRSGYLFA